MRRDDLAALILFFGITAYALFGGCRLRRRVLGPHRGRRRAGAAAACAHRPLDRAGVGGQPRLVDLLARRAVDRVRPAFASITLTLFVPLTFAALGIVLRGSSFAFRKAVFRTRDQRNFGAAFALSSVLVPYCMGAVAGAIASGRVPAGGKAGDPGHELDQPDVGRRWRPRGHRLRLPRRGVPGVGRAAPRGPDMDEYFRRRAIGAAVVAGVVAVVGIFVLHADATYVFDGLTSRALPLVIVSAVCGIGSLVLLARGASDGAACCRSARWPPWWSAGASPSGPTSCRRP